ncbi:MAG TPA: translation initiation factor 2, partial [Anaeromyxobacteraceae bacterium]
MKTLTELSGSVIRTAAAAIAEARRSLPKEEKPAEAAVPEVAPPAAEGAAPDAASEKGAAEGAVAGPASEPGAAEGAVADPASEAGAAAVEAAEAPTPPPATPTATPPAAPSKPKPERAPESEAVKAALDEAVAKATGFSGDRLAMLRAAVEAAGRRAQDVRLVRVFGLEEPLSGAQTIGEHQYLLDFFPQHMKQVAGSPKDEKGRGGRGGGRGGGGGGGG